MNRTVHFFVLAFLVVLLQSFVFQNSDDKLSEKLNQIKLQLEERPQKEALVSLYAFLELAKSSNNTQLIVEANLLLADIYRDNGDYKKSNTYLSKSIKHAKKDYDNLQVIYFKKGGNFQHEGIIDSARVNYQKAIDVGVNIKDKYDLKAKVHANISGIFYLQENYSKAIEHSLIAVHYQEILGNKEIEAGILNNLGSIYYMTGRYDEALETFERALGLVGFGQEELQKKTRNSSYINIAYAYSGLGNFEKAFEYQDKYFSLNDSLSQEMKYKEIAEIESKYRVATKEKEAEIERGKRKEAEILMYVFGAAVLLLLTGGYILYKFYTLNKKNYSLEIEQRKLIHQANIEKIRGEAQSKILAATLDGRIEERRKIAMVLHDNISALLSAANLHLFASKKQINGEIPIEISKTQSILNEASEQIRDLSHNLVSAVLLKFGLEVASQDLCEKSSNSTIEFELKAENVIRFEQSFELKLFNIINELVNNILKHSEASKAIIEMFYSEGVLKLNFKDNGVGFDVHNISENSGIGLSQIDARIKALKGELKIDSSKNGTLTSIMVPVVF